TYRGQVHLTRRKSDLADFLAVNVDDGEGIDNLRRQGDAAAGPSLGDGDLPLIPGCGDPPQVGALPARMDVEGLAVLLNVVGVSRPEAGDLEIAPSVGRDGLRPFLPRLPAPQAVETDALAGGSRFAMGLAQLPDGFHPGGEHRVGRGLSPSPCMRPRETEQKK